MNLRDDDGTFTTKATAIFLALASLVIWVITVIPFNAIMTADMAFVWRSLILFFYGVALYLIFFKVWLLFASGSEEKDKMKKDAEKFSNSSRREE